MTGSTSKLGLPYPTGTDPVSSGDDMIKALADALDSGMIPYRMAAGTKVLPNITTAASSVAVGIPAGRFTQPPLVICAINNNPTGGNKAIARAVVSSPTAFTIYVNSGDGTAMTCNGLAVTWFAIQMLPGQSNGGDA